MRGNSHARCGAGEKTEIISKSYLSLSWRPSDLEQRAGRIARQGNTNSDVYIRRYVTEATFDAYLYQTVENKQRFISQIMSSKSPVRSCEDVDETALSYAEIKALCAGNPLIKEKMDLDIEVSRLRLLKAEHQSQHHRLEDSLLRSFPLAIEATKSSITGYEKDLAMLETMAPKKDDEFPPMTVLGVTHWEKEKAGIAMLESCKAVVGKESVPIGSYRGLDMSLAFDGFNKAYELTLKGNMSYRVEMGRDVFGNITRINNALSNIPQRLGNARQQLGNLRAQVEDAKAELTKPFPQDAELEEKAARLAFLDAELNIDGNGECELGGMDDEGEVAKSTRNIAKGGKPSIMDRLLDYDGKSPSGTDRHKNNDISI